MNSLKFITVALILTYYAAGCGKLTGPIGTTGKAATPCQTNAITGGVEVTCPGQAPLTVYNGADGPQGLPGTPGDPGATGATGSQGAPGTNGQDGTDATPITVVELCPSYGATSYPNSFPELAVCLDNNLYGVYWSGTEAFLAEIVPGTYASTSPDACTLTVAANCVVSQD